MLTKRRAKEDRPGKDEKKKTRMIHEKNKTNINRKKEIDGAIDR